MVPIQPSVVVVGEVGTKDGVPFEVWTDWWSDDRLIEEPSDNCREQSALLSTWSMHCVKELALGDKGCDEGPVRASFLY